MKALRADGSCRVSARWPPALSACGMPIASSIASAVKIRC